MVVSAERECGKASLPDRTRAPRAPRGSSALEVWEAWSQTPPLGLGALARCSSAATLRAWQVTGIPALPAERLAHHPMRPQS